MNSYKDSEIWSRIKKECINDKEISTLTELCDNAIDLSKTIRDTFPSYTLHDERHIYNVIDLMEKLLEPSGVDKLSLGECELLLLSACYHDIGMCYRGEDKDYEFASSRFRKYLDENDEAYIKVNKADGRIPEEVQLDYLRNIHHLRIKDLFPHNVGPLSVRRDHLLDVCKSHNEDISEIIKLQYDPVRDVDCCFCAILLRIADVLDFDFTRTPSVLYEWQKIGKADNFVANREWKKHMASSGFKFVPGERKVLYFAATCEEMQNEHIITDFLRYIEMQLTGCNSIISKSVQEKWRHFRLPEKIEESIERRGYQTGEYCLTLDAERVLQLLVGDDIYTSDTVFVRELLQNAFDAVWARSLVDPKWSDSENAIVKVSSWYDSDGKQWFRVDDYGIGMNEVIIRDYFLKAGRSYYQSAQFERARLTSIKGYIPISKFGIGILSCFLNGSEIEVGTRYYDKGDGIRFNMYGLKGYYSIAVEEQGDNGTPLPSAYDERKENFRQEAGTSVAVKMDRALSESMEEILRTYVCFPRLSVCYKGEGSWKNLPTEQDFMNLARKIGLYKIRLPEETLNEICQKMPEIKWIESPYISVRCTPLDECSESPYISGVDFEIMLERHSADIKKMIDGGTITRSLCSTLQVRENDIQVKMYYETHFNVIDFLPFSSEVEDFWKDYKRKNEYIRKYAEKLEHNGCIEKEDLENEEDAKVIDELLLLYNLKMTENDSVVFQVPFSENELLSELMQKFILPRCMKNTGVADNDLTEMAYEGIRINSRNLVRYHSESYFRYTAVLLSGKFQPTLSLNREVVRSFPIEAATYIEMLGKRIANSSLSCYCPHYENLLFGDFLQLFENENTLNLIENTLQIRYKVTIKNIKEELLQKRQPITVSLPIFESIYYPDAYEQEEFYYSNILLRAVLQKEFEIWWVQDGCGCMNYQIIGLRKSDISEEEKIFVPLMFVKSRDNDIKILTEDGEVIKREAINASHPLAVWLVRHASYLQSRHHRIFKEICKSLCEMRSSEMTAKINDLLTKLARDTNIEITNNLWLKEENFLYYKYD